MKEILVGLGTCGISAGGEAVLTELKHQVAERYPDINVKETGCVGLCCEEVLMEYRENGSSYLYAHMTPEKVRGFVEKHLEGPGPVEEWIIRRDGVSEIWDAYFSKQKRIVLRNCGVIDPNSISEYMARGGYGAVRKVLETLTAEEVISMVEQSGLRGRGGGGFPTGKKWHFARQAAGDAKYVICNADEGDPGAFMDRSVLEGDPHAVLEGMMIAAYAIGASTGIIYVRAEYPKAIERLKTALAACREHGFLGKNICGTGFTFDILIKEGAGAFVCGEETALIASIEGRRGVPRIRPPFPANSGLFGKPTNINNVETYANIPAVILQGPGILSSIGTEKSRGTKVFALAGKIARSGLVEVPMGITISEIIFDIGGGIRDGKKFKAVQMGGPSGGCIPASMADLRIDYEEITRTGAIMGSGGMIVLDETTCMVDVARFFLNFTQNESCGKCTFCRIGTKRMLELLEKITAGEGEEGDLEKLENLAHSVAESSLCGLGQTAPNPVLTTLRYFREEYEAHIRQKICPAHSCAALVRYSINPDLCTGCTLCARRCPAGAVAGVKKEPHKIDQEKCVKCELCYDSCKFDAVVKI